MLMENRVVTLSAPWSRCLESVRQEVGNCCCCCFVVTCGLLQHGQAMRSGN